MDRGWTGIDTRWVGGRGAAVYNLRLPPKASGEDTGAGPAPGFKRLRATAGQGPNYVGPCCGILGLCWPILRAMWAHLGAMLAYLESYVGRSGGLCGPMLSQKSRKMGTAKNHCKTQDILTVGGLSWGYVGPSWGYVGLSWGQCGPILGLCWPSLGLCWPILELWWPILGLSWPILGAMLPHLGAMFAHLEAYVGPCWPTLSHRLRKMGKKGKSKIPCKTQDILAAGGVCGRGRGPSLLRRGENRRTAMPRPGGPWPDFKGCRPLPPTPEKAEEGSKHCVGCSIAPEGLTSPGKPTKIFT